MTVTTNGTGEAATISTAAAQARLEQMAGELQGQLEQAKEHRDAIVQTLKEHDQLVERLTIAAKALAGPIVRGPYKKTKNYTGALADPDPQLMQLVEVTIARQDEPVTIKDLMELIPGRSENTVRRIVYTLRDDGRIRIVTAGKGPHAATYAAMPEVVAEHAD